MPVSSSRRAARLQLAPAVATCRPHAYAVGCWCRYVVLGDVVQRGYDAPKMAMVYLDDANEQFAQPAGYDLVGRHRRCICILALCKLRIKIWNAMETASHMSTSG